MSFHVILLGVEKSKLPSGGRGIGRLRPAMTAARRLLVRGRGRGAGVEGNQPIGAQALDKGIVLVMYF